MPHTAQSQALLDVIAEQGQASFWTLAPRDARIQTAGIAAVVPPGPALHDVQDMLLDLPGVQLGARLYRPTAEADGVVVYFHGGGWVLGQMDDVDAVCRHLASRSNWAILSVDYRLAPEHSFPVPVLDAVAATRWALSFRIEGINPDRIVVSGDSAGGNLAAVAANAIAMEDGGWPVLKGQLLIYPVTAADFDTLSYREWGEGSLLTAAAMSWFWGHYIADSSRRNDPLASPLKSKVVNSRIPALLILAECDPLRSEGEAYAALLRSQGATVEAAIFEGVPHGFFTMPGIIDEASEAIDRATFWLKSLVG